MPLEKCSKCSKKLTPEERLLSTIFGNEEPLCYDCSAQSHRLSCSKCKQEASVMVNGNSYCPECAGKLYPGKEV